MPAPQSNLDPISIPAKQPPQTGTHPPFRSNQPTEKRPSIAGSTISAAVAELGRLEKHGNKVTETASRVDRAIRGRYFLIGGRGPAQLSALNPLFFARE